MKTNELRLGNYLQLDGENYHVSEIQNSLQCVEIKRKNLENPKINDYEECDLDCDDLLPIPLTEEILLKCGFRKSKSGTYLFDKFSFDLSDFEFGVESDYYYLTVAENIKSLHQLQNLYFALTGQDLEIKL